MPLRKLSFHSLGRKGLWDKAKPYGFEVPKAQDAWILRMCCCDGTRGGGGGGGDGGGGGGGGGGGPVPRTTPLANATSLRTVHSRASLGAFELPA